MDQSQLKMKCAYLARFEPFCSIGFFGLVWFDLVWLSKEEVSSLLPVTRSTKHVLLCCTLSWPLIVGHEKTLVEHPFSRSSTPEVLDLGL